MIPGNAGDQIDLIFGQTEKIQRADDIFAVLVMRAVIDEHA